MIVSLLGALMLQDKETKVLPFISGDKWGYKLGKVKDKDYFILAVCDCIYTNENEAFEEGSRALRDIQKIDLSEEKKRFSRDLL